MSTRLGSVWKLVQTHWSSMPFKQRKKTVTLVMAEEDEVIDHVVMMGNDWKSPSTHKWGSYSPLAFISGPIRLAQMAYLAEYNKEPTTKKIEEDDKVEVGESVAAVIARPVMSQAGQRHLARLGRSRKPKVCHTGVVVCGWHSLNWIKTVTEDEESMA